MNALAAINKETETKQNIIQKTGTFITTAVESSATIVLNLVMYIGNLPNELIARIKGLSNPDNRSRLIDLLQTLIAGLSLACLVEYGTRRLMRHVRIKRPQRYALKQLPAHVLRSVLPLVLFGIVAYMVVFTWQKGVNDVAFKSFVAMTAVIMLRTSWLVLRVLFSSRHVDIVAAGQEVTAISYQFIVATCQIILIGIIFAEIGDKLGIGDIAYQVWLRIIGFGVVSLMIIASWKTRYKMANLIAYEDDHSRGLTIIMHKIFELLGRYNHWLVTVILCLSYFFWLLGMQEPAWHLFYSLLISLGLTVIVIRVRHAILRISESLHQKLTYNTKHLILASASQSQMIVVNFLQISLHFLYFMLLFQVWGADPLSVLANPTIQPYITSGVSIIIILVIIRAMWLWVDYAARAQMQPRRVGRRNVEASLFSKTITPILRSVGHWVLTIMAIVLIMEEIGIPIMPIIYGISVIGIAISLGAQSLVKDLINGILTLMEGNIAVGEVVVVGAHTGTVESLSLRGISLRHGTGALQTIPFSEVTNIINKSRDYAVIPIELQVSYGVDLESVGAVLQQAYDRLKADPAFAHMIIEPLSIAGIDKFTDNGVSIVGSIKTKPDSRNQVARAFNGILKQLIEQEKLFPPHPTTLTLNRDIARSD